MMVIPEIVVFVYAGFSIAPMRSGLVVLRN